MTWPPLHSYIPKFPSKFPLNFSSFPPPFLMHYMKQTIFSNNVCFMIIFILPYPTLSASNVLQISQLKHIAASRQPDSCYLAVSTTCLPAHNSSSICGHNSSCSRNSSRTRGHNSGRSNSGDRVHNTSRWHLASVHSAPSADLNTRHQPLTLSRCSFSAVSRPQHQPPIIRCSSIAISRPQHPLSISAISHQATCQPSHHQLSSLPLVMWRVHIIIL